MRRGLALALGLLVGGCARTPPPMPPPVPLADLPAAPPALGPSAQQVSILYQQYQDRLPCPEEATCGRARRLPVGFVDCDPSGENAMRCSFVVSAKPYGKPDLYRCTGLFRTNRDGWQLTRLLDMCQAARWRALP